MKKTLMLSESDIKAVMAEKFKIDSNDVHIGVDFADAGEHYEPKVTIMIESEVQNYDV